MDLLKVIVNSFDIGGTGSGEGRGIGIPAMSFDSVGIDIMGHGGGSSSSSSSSSVGGSHDSLVEIFEEHSPRITTGIIIVWIVTSLLTLLSLLLTGITVTRHALNMNKKWWRLQLLYFFLFMLVPVLSISSQLSLYIPKISHLTEFIKGCYEAVVIFVFFRLMVIVLGGRLQAIQHFAKRSRWCKVWFHYCSIGTLQFVIVRPLLGIVTVFLIDFNLYHSGLWKLNDAFLWIKLIGFISALYAFNSLFVFYQITKKRLKKWNPLWKFMCIKLLLYVTTLNVIKDHELFLAEEIATGIQNTLIIIEMVFEIILLSYAYSWKNIDKEVEIPDDEQDESIDDVGKEGENSNVNEEDLEKMKLTS